MQVKCRTITNRPTDRLANSLVTFMLVSAGALQSGQLVGKWSTSSASRSSVSAVEPSTAAPTAVCPSRGGFPSSPSAAAPFYDRERKERVASERGTLDKNLLARGSAAAAVHKRKGDSVWRSRNARGANLRGTELCSAKRSYRCSRNSTAIMGGTGKAKGVLTTCPRNVCLRR